MKETTAHAVTARNVRIDSRMVALRVRPYPTIYLRSARSIRPVPAHGVHIRVKPAAPRRTAAEADPAEIAYAALAWSDGCTARAPIDSRFQALIMAITIERSASSFS